MVTWENYEELMIMHADGELCHEDEQALLAFVQEHPELKSELELYTLTKLTYDPEEIFADKSALIKPLPAKRIMAMPQWKRYAVAAGIAALLFPGLYRYMWMSKDNEEVAVKNTAIHTSIAAKTAKDNSQNVTQAPPLTAVQDSSRQETAVHIAKIKTAHAVSRKTQQQVHSTDAVHIATVAHEPAMAKLALAARVALPCGNEGGKHLDVKQIPTIATAPGEEIAKSSFWSRLPIDDLKKKQLEKMAGAVANAYKDASNAKEDEGAVSVRVEKRKLVISF